MFNREIKVGLVKRGTEQTSMSPEENEANLEAKVAVVTKAVERGIRKIGIVVCAYVVLDTVRQVIVKSSK